jgi:hypothetical protein
LYYGSGFGLIRYPLCLHLIRSGGIFLLPRNPGGYGGPACLCALPGGRRGEKFVVVFIEYLFLYHSGFALAQTHTGFPLRGYIGSVPGFGREGIGISVLKRTENPEIVLDSYPADG